MPAREDGTLPLFITLRSMWLLKGAAIIWGNTLSSPKEALNLTVDELMSRFQDRNV